MLPGKKTYLMSALFIAYAGIGFLIGEVSGSEFVQLVLEGGGLAALRNGVAKRIAS